MILKKVNNHIKIKELYNIVERMAEKLSYNLGKSHR